MPGAYRVLLGLLPRKRRARYGHEMATVFADVVAEARRSAGWRGVALAWARETAGMLRFSMRELTARLARAVERSSLRMSNGRWNFPAETRWAWRGVRTRGWRAVFLVALLAVALSANVTMFSVVDSLLLNPQPFPDAGRIVQLSQKYGQGERIDGAVRARLLDAWRQQSDVFSGVTGHLQKNIFLTGGGPDALTRTADVTVDFFTVLGIQPRWGRSFGDADLDDAGVFPVVISERLARSRFGTPELAIGRTLPATAGPHLVVGVMPASFAFPRVGFDVWRLMAVDGPLTRNFGGPPLMARLADGVTVEQLPVLLDVRAAAVGAGAGLNEYAVTAGPFLRPMPSGTRRVLLFTLLGAAFCLLLAACANVASLELAFALRRCRSSAVHLALGGGHGSLARVAALEGLLLVGGAMVAGLALTRLGIATLHRTLATSLLTGTANPIDFDFRVVAFAAGVAALAWVLASLPPILGVLRLDLSAVLRSEDRTTAVSPASVRVRQLLTIGQVTAAVVLTIGGWLYARSYLELLAVDKGFDSSRLVVAGASAPATFFGPSESRSQFIERLLDVLRAVPGVSGVTASSPPPDLGDSPSETILEVDGRIIETPVHLGQKWVDAEFFEVIGLPLRAGRLFQPEDPPGQVVISEAFAKRLWPNENPIGRTFIGTGNSPYAYAGPFRVIGVVGDFRSGATRMPDPSDTRLFMYSLTSHFPQRMRETSRNSVEIDTGGSYTIVSATVRVDSPIRIASMADAVARIAPRLRFTFTPVDDEYAAQNADTLLASQIVSAFSVLAVIVALAGIYGVMAFLVAGRTREIGIRMALGADRRAIGRMVLGSSTRLVLWGAVVGSGSALLASRWIESQLFGVSPADPVTYLAVSGAVVIAALLASWHPARLAARVDPAITLRAE